MNNDNRPDHDGASLEPDTTEMPGGPELDALLGTWHQQNRAAAAAGRDRLLEALKREDAAGTNPATPNRPEVLFPTRPSAPARAGWRSMGRWGALAAAMITVALILPRLIPSSLNGRGGGLMERSALAGTTIMCPEGGRLEAIDQAGNTLGPCVLRHTDVNAEISGRFARITVRQQFENPNPDKIEAVYTFPLSECAAVDRMKMTIGQRVIVGEVHERDEAREIYEAAKDAGRVASLLEQERPNIFTQSVANIEPGAQIEVEISYVETVEQHDGEFSFVFPTVVSPRYIPGQTAGELIQAATHKGGNTRDTKLPTVFTPRRGLVALAPPFVQAVTVLDSARPASSPAPETIKLALTLALPINCPESAAAPTASEAATGDMHSGSSSGAAPASDWMEFSVRYPDGSIEPGFVRDDGAGAINGRWYYSPLLASLANSASHAPTPPDGAAAHSETISAQSKPDVNASAQTAQADRIQPGAPFAQNTNQVPDASRITPMPVPPPMRAGHDLSITVQIDTGGPGITGLQSPLHKIVNTDMEKRPDGLARLERVSLARLAEIPNRDFVLKWKQTADTVQEAVFTHTGAHGNFLGVLLQPPERVADDNAVPRELVFVLDTSGSMSGVPIETAKRVMTRGIESMRPFDRFNVITFAGDTRVLWPEAREASEANKQAAMTFVNSKRGGGGTEMMAAIDAALRPDGVDESRADRARRPRPQPLRVVIFLTDGEVGNDMAIIDAVRHYRHSTRVFSFGIGNSVNRYLLSGMAQAGGGEAEFVLIPHAPNELSPGEIDTIIERFTRRVRTPVLTSIRIDPSENLQLLDLQPESGNVPDVFDISPVMLLARFPDRAAPVSGTITIHGETAVGPWKKTVPVTLPASGAAPGHDVLATLWARREIESIMNGQLLSAQRGAIDDASRQRIVELGRSFSILSQYTSFVAVDKLRVTIDGRPRLVHVPIELPDQTDWTNYFGAVAMPAEADTGKEYYKDADKDDAEVAPRALLGDIPQLGTQAEKRTDTAAPARPSSSGAPPATDGASKERTAPPPPGTKPASRERRSAPPPTSATTSTPPPPIPPASSAAPTAGATVSNPGEAGRPTGATVGVENRDSAETLGRTNSPARTQKRSLQAGHGAEVPHDAHLQIRYAGASVDTDLLDLKTESARKGKNQSRAHDDRSAANDIGGAFVGDSAVMFDEGLTQRQSAPAVPPQMVAAAQVWRNSVALRQLSPADQNTVDAQKFVVGGELAAEPIVAEWNQVVNNLQAGDPHTQVAEVGQRARNQFDRYAVMLNKLDPALIGCLNQPWLAQQQSLRTQTIQQPERGSASSQRRSDANPAQVVMPQATLPDPILIVVLVADTSEPTLAALRRAGLEIVSVSIEDRVVVGRASLSSIEPIASIEETRRIEPIRDE